MSSQMIAQATETQYLSWEEFKEDFISTPKDGPYTTIRTIYKKDNWPPRWLLTTIYNRPELEEIFNFGSLPFSLEENEIFVKKNRIKSTHIYENAQRSEKELLRDRCLKFHGFKNLSTYLDEVWKQ